MAAAKGTRPPNAGKGRKPGVPNKTTADVRAAIAQIAQNSVEEVEEWLREIKNPATRVSLFLDLCEYHIPKLQRTELTGPGGEKFEVHIVRYSPTK